MYADDDPLNVLHPTLVRPPRWAGIWGERVLPLRPEDYRVEHTGPHWTRVYAPDGEIVYDFVGPAEVIRSPAPF
ncbi:hypothetical protein [Delftia acidovorans]|uniref:hypothetical protein n=1 Tax=Delftia acidovorans TaxID=80866 RepID=UPI002FDD3CFB